MTTPNDILTGAFAKSVKNRAALITIETEGLELVKRAMRGLYSAAAMVNPEFFSVIASAVDAVGGAWPRPENAESVYLIEVSGAGADVAEVSIVDYRDRLRAEPGRPCVYRQGKNYWPAGNGKGPTVSDDLDIHYSKIPDDPANADTTLDPTWVDQFNELLIDEVAIYLALKDRRFEELGELKAARNDWAKLFLHFLQHETINITRRMANIRRVNVEDILPLLAGSEAA